MTKDEILSAVKKYYLEEKEKETAFKPGDRLNYAGRNYDEKELVNLVDSALEFWLTAGRFTKKFEEGFAKFMNVPFSAVTNSGSSANLLAVAALTSSLLPEDRRLNKGDEVITVAAAFPTTVAPIIQCGAIPVFVDITLPMYNIDVTKLEEAYSKGKTKAVVIAHSLGNPFNLSAVKDFCDEHNLWLVEDNCDGTGGTYEYKGEIRMVGTIGDIGTSSFYPAHQLTMGEGGAVYTKNPLLNKIVRSLRDWGRECVCSGGQDNLCGHRFDGQFGTLPKGYDHKYVYSHIGYNLKITDMQAAIGCAQLEKLPDFVEKRRRHWDYLRENLDDLKDCLILPEKETGANPCWFGFIVTVRDDVAKSRKEIVDYIENHNMQTRNLFAGNILRHPAFLALQEGKDYRVAGDLSVTDRVMEKSFWVGVHPGLTDSMLKEMVRIIKEAVRL